MRHTARPDLVGGRYRDRTDAGRRLADELANLELDRPLVLALPRGGVPVAFEVAARLSAPLDVVVARKIGAPGQPEYGIGAIAEGDAVVIDARVVALLGIDEEEIGALIERERVELERRVGAYRGGRPLPRLEDHDVVLVDDGLATGVTAEAALRSLRQGHPRRLVLAVPVCAPPTVERLLAWADTIVCPNRPAVFQAVGRWYENFDQTTDDEVRDVLARSVVTS